MSRKLSSPPRQSQKSGPPTAVQNLLANAIREYQAGRLEEAKQLYLQILAIDAKHAKSLYGLGLVLQQTGNNEAAARMMERAIAVDRHEAKYHSGLGAVLYAQHKLDEALATYQRALALKPNDEETIFLLGNLLLYQGMQEKNQAKLKEAESHYKRSLALRPDAAETYNNLGLVAHHQGKPEQARERFERALVLNPDFAEAHNNLGNVFQDQKKLEEATVHYKRALALKPDYADVENNMGLILQKKGKLNEAKRQFERALAIEPNLPETHNNLGTILRDEGKLEEARAHHERAFALRPNYAQAHNNLGIVLQGMSKVEEAVAAHERAIELMPDFAEAHNNLGVALRDLGRLDAAAAAHEKALELLPEFPEAFNNLGVVRRDQGRADEAETWFGRALALKPDYAEAHCNMGNAFKSRGRLKEARTSYERAEALKPDSIEPKWNRCLIDLLEGNYSAGWRGYEVRHRRKTGRPRSFPQPQWNGEPLNGARILLHAEQGLGDSLQFLRYVPMVQAAGGAVLLDVPLALRRLAAQLPGLAALTATGEPLEPFAWHCPLMSLPLAFGTEVDSIPAPVPYLMVPEEAARAADALLWPEEGLRVGLVWSGNAKYSEDFIRSIPQALIKNLLDTGGVRFFSLQLGEATSQLTASEVPIVDLQATIKDMADTAALMGHMDLIISVDTSVAHLAAGLAKPTWILLPFTPDWRWLTGRQDSPWYPTVRLFRQPRFNDWQSVIASVRSELAALAEEKHR